MSYRPQSSFSAGELDPALRERTNLIKYETGLGILRNAYIGKTGRVISRPGTPHFVQPKFPNKKCLVYSPPYTQYVVEWGDQYVRIYTYSVGANGLEYAGTFTDDAHPFTEADLPNIHFVTSGQFVYVFCTGKTVLKLYLGVLGALSPFDKRFLSTSDIFLLVPPPDSYTVAATAGTGYNVDYAFTYVLDGLESDYIEVPNSATGLKLPVTAGTLNGVIVNIPTPAYILAMPAGPAKNAAALAYRDRISAVNAYRRPTGGNAYGFIGSVIAQTILPSVGAFTDVGADADFAHQPPASIQLSVATPAHSNNVTQITSRTGAIYQQRLLITDDANKEAIYASRTGYQNSFFADNALSSDSAVSFKSGTSGAAIVLRISDSVLGLLVFTTAGVYQSQGALDFNNLTLTKRGNWVINERVPPLDIPGITMFVDKSTNSIRGLVYSYVEQAFPSEEISIYSNHLLTGKTVVSWAYQEGYDPLIWIVLDDGSLLSLTYQRESQMQAWAHHDSNGAIYESVTVLKDVNAQSIVHFVVNRNGTRSIETLAPRVVDDIKNFVGMDNAKLYKQTVVGLDGNPTVLTIIPSDISDWSEPLQINSSTPAFGATGKAVGDILRYFDNQNSAVDLRITQVVSNQEIIVQPLEEFPSDQSNGPTLYLTANEFSGLDYLEGQNVSVFVDGYVVSSPNNDAEDYPTLTVNMGKIILPNRMRGAIVSIGIPFTSDVETLELDTVEQKPTLLESKIVNKVWLKVLNSRGLFVSTAELPINDSVEGMEDPETREEDINTGVIGNAAESLTTKRLQIICRNDWSQQGRVNVRQVDPLPFEILSIIPDLQVLI